MVSSCAMRVLYRVKQGKIVAIEQVYFQLD
jgi:hypothetical protein